MAVEGQRPADQGVQDDPQAPDVHLRPVVLLALEKLRRRVWRGAAKRVQFGAQPEFVAEAEIRDLDVGVGVQQEVLSLRGAKGRRWGAYGVLRGFYGVLRGFYGALWGFMGSLWGMETTRPAGGTSELLWGSYGVPMVYGDHQDYRGRK